VSYIQNERNSFHRSLLEDVLFLEGEDQVPSNADRNNRLSLELARGLIERMGVAMPRKRQVAQRSGRLFEVKVKNFILNTFLKLDHLRPGTWTISTNAVDHYEQYSHIKSLSILIDKHPEIATAFGTDYFITPDIVVSRSPESDENINKKTENVSDDLVLLSSLRRKNNVLELMHASISCKWTIRSDRAQNSRTEAWNLIRNRKGRAPHIMVVTAEPLPCRLASIALGTGDIDCVYHIALYELSDFLKHSSHQDAWELLHNMIAGKRIKDISDLPFDLAV